MFSSLLQDLRLAVRTLRKSPVFALTAILTLALGIGASTAVFTVVDSVILKPLSYHDSGQLVVAWERVLLMDNIPGGPNPRHFNIWRQRSTAFQSMTLVQTGAAGLSMGDEHPNLVGIVTCLPNLFDLLQVAPFIGRSFVAEDGIKDHDNVAILSYDVWQNQFGGDRNIIGKTVRISDNPKQIVGVLPADYHFPNRNALRAYQSFHSSTKTAEPGIYLATAMDFDDFAWNGEYGNWVALGRLKPEVTPAQAEAQLIAIQAQILQEMPANQRDPRPNSISASVQPMQDAIVGDTKSSLWMLMAAVLGLMLIACLNLANAQLGRTLSRSREAAVRTALGAGKGHLIWSVLAENLLLAVIGCAGGIFLASSGLDLFRHYSPVDLPRLSEVHLNFTVLAFSILLAVSASLISGIVPALRLLRADPQATLQQNSTRSLGSRQSNRLRSWLIGLQVFGCTALLLLTGLFSKSLLYLLNQEKGFDTSQTAVAEVRLPFKTYEKKEQRVDFDNAVLRNLRSIPGAQTVGLVSAMPLEGESWIESMQRIDRPDQKTPQINLRWVSEGYFEAMHERLVAGRFFEERDRNLSSAVLSEGEARALWPHENPIGGQVQTEGRKFTVIGVVADSRNASLKTNPPKVAYVHYVDRPPFATYFIVRGSQSGDALLGSMRQAIWGYAPGITIARVKTLDSQVRDSLATERFETMVLIAFGSGALLLAMLGIYGVLSYSVVTRRQEIGLRMALGASKSNIYSLTMARAGIPVFAGIAAGLIASIAAARVIRNLLYGVHALDPLVTLVVTALFLGAAFLAAWLPARRAGSVDPMETLRAD